MTDYTPYDYAIDPQGDATANKVIGFVGTNRRVLEIGTATGVITRELAARGCAVTGVEIDPEMAKRAAPYCSRMIVGDIEAIDLEAEFGKDGLEVLVAADVLEHLRDPWGLLERARRVLVPDGYAVLSIPNVGHASVIAGLLDGRFDYQVKGLLDRTHLRFFTRSGIEDMLLSTGWIPVAWETNRVSPLASEFAGRWLDLPPRIRSYLSAQPGSDVYQYIVKAAPSHETGWQTRLRSRIQGLEEDLRDIKVKLVQRDKEYEATVSDLKEHQKAFQGAKEWIKQLQDEVEEVKKALEEKKAELTEVKKALEEKKVELDKALYERARLAEEIERLKAPLALRIRAMVRRLLVDKQDGLR